MYCEVDTYIYTYMYPHTHMRHPRTLLLCRLFQQDALILHTVCMYVCVYTCVCMYVCRRIHICIHTCTHMRHPRTLLPCRLLSTGRAHTPHCMHVCMCVCMYIYGMYGCTCVYMCGCMYRAEDTYMDRYIYVCVCICIYIYYFIYLFSIQKYILTYIKHVNG